MMNILIVSRSYEHAKFFFRMKDSLIIENYNLIFITTVLYVYLYLKKKGCEVYLVTKKIARKGKTIVVEDCEIKDCLEFKLNTLDLIQSRLVYQAIYYQALQINKNKKINMVFIWNGNCVADFAACDFAKNNHIKSLYFEIANIPGRIFVDRLGTNAKSELYINRKIINRFFINMDSYSQWKVDYLQKKMNSHIVPQAKTIYSKFYLQAVINIIGYYLYIKIDNSSKLIKHKILHFSHSIAKHIEYDNIDFKKMKYIFFPLQVSSDSQILLNSTIGLMEGVQHAIKRAKAEKCSLIIKLHPAETDINALKSIFELKKKHKFYIVNDNTFQLIKYADFTITINSTVGLEAMILGKKIEILGNAIYENFTESDLAKYILGYLVAIDFFSDDAITGKQIQILLSRI